MMNETFVDYEVFGGMSEEEDRKSFFDSLNYSLIRDYFANDMACPCDSCPLALKAQWMTKVINIKGTKVEEEVLLESCMDTGKECSAFRQWCTKGQYKDEQVLKHLRSAVD